ncbi:ion channel [Haloferula sp.]|uniref:ion channel n=1 Tax=Haloferula sp. TaxID=2497595 RepID=UPI00329DA56C
MIDILTLLLMMLLNLVLELIAISLSVSYMMGEYRKGRVGMSHVRDSLTLGVVFSFLMLAHLLQIGLWAGAFVWCGEFDDFRTAYYHSAVNFASLGYGDLVMSEEWRLLGGLEAAVGVMMFGVSGAVLFAFVGNMIRFRAKEEDKINRGRDQ